MGEVWKYDAFLSYSGKDRKSVRRIQRILERYRHRKTKRTLKIYLDDTDIRGGALSQELGEAIRHSRCLVLCCSANSRDSSWIRFEIAEFLKRSNPVVAPIVLAGEPRDVIPSEILALDPRFHDLRQAWLLGVLKPRGRDELLRLIALLSGDDLREIIDWNRRILIRQGLLASAGASVLGASTIFYVNRQRRIKMTDVSAKVTLGWWMDAGDRKLPDLSALFTDGVRLELAGLPRSRAPVRPPTGWTKGERFGAPAKLILKSASEVQQISSKSSGSVDGLVLESLRTFTQFSGTLGQLEMPDEWPGAVVEAWLRGLQMKISPPSEDAASLSQAFERQYGPLADVAGKYGDDYRVQPLPLRATFELSVQGRPVARSTGLAARVWEWDEDVRRLVILHFPATLCGVSSPGAQ